MDGAAEPEIVFDGVEFASAGVEFVSAGADTVPTATEAVAGGSDASAVDWVVDMEAGGRNNTSARTGAVKLKAMRGKVTARAQASMLKRARCSMAGTLIVVRASSSDGPNAFWVSRQHLK